MRQREALNDLAFDILQLSKRKNKKLIIALVISLIINVFFLCMLFDIKTNGVQVVEETIIAGAVIAKKPSEHIVTRQKLKNIYEVKTFEDLLERCVLTDDEKYILRQHYLHGKSFVAISLDMNYSEDAIKHKHQKILKKIKRLL